MFIKVSILDIREVESEYTIFVGVLESQEQCTQVPHSPLPGLGLGNEPLDTAINIRHLGLQCLRPWLPLELFLELPGSF